MTKCSWWTTLTVRRPIELQVGLVPEGGRSRAKCGQSAIPPFTSAAPAEVIRVRLITVGGVQALARIQVPSQALVPPPTAFQPDVGLVDGIQIQGEVVGRYASSVRERRGGERRGGHSVVLRPFRIAPVISDRPVGLVGVCQPVMADAAVVQVDVVKGGARPSSRPSAPLLVASIERVQLHDDVVDCGVRVRAPRVRVVEAVSIPPSTRSIGSHGIGSIRGSHGRPEGRLGIPVTAASSSRCPRRITNDDVLGESQPARLRRPPTGISVPRAGPSTRKRALRRERVVRRPLLAERSLLLPPWLLRMLIMALLPSGILAGRPHIICEPAAGVVARGHAVPSAVAWGRHAYGKEREGERWRQTARRDNSSQSPLP